MYHHPPPATRESATTIYPHPHRHPLSRPKNNHMDPTELGTLFQSFQIPKTHATVGLANWMASNKQIHSLLIHRRLPDYGWSDLDIQTFLLMLATLDTNTKQSFVVHNNNYSNNSNINSNSNKSNNATTTRWCGVGEREGRVYSALVAQRHFGFSHGMGRSGDITEPQPKAAGSSLMVQLTRCMVLDAIRRGSGIQQAAAHGILLPLCTGMSMSLVLSSLRDGSPPSNTRRIVLWSRIDQKSCFKAIASAGLECVVVPTKVEGDQVVTDLSALALALETHGDAVLAVITTTSCFAPRIPDLVDQVAKLCAKANVYHIINHAYGLQCAKTSKLINRACVVGRVDAVVCSTDKNFLVPVGGAIVLSPHQPIVDRVGKVYAGRASSSPIMDLFITLLSMGFNGYTSLLQQRQTLLETFPQRLAQIAEAHGERLLQCPSNTISFGITLDTLPPRPKKDDEAEQDYLNAVQKDISSLGAMLFSRCVSGTRVIPRGEIKSMGGQHIFQGFGSSVDQYPHAYMTAACAIGVHAQEVDEFLKRLDKTLKEFKAKQRKKGCEKAES